MRKATALICFHMRSNARLTPAAFLESMRGYPSGDLFWVDCYKPNGDEHNRGNHD